MQPILARVRQLLEQLRIDPATTRLRWWLAGSEVVIVLMVAGGLSLYAGDRLRQVADSQGTARVQLGGAMARETLRRMQEDALTSARSIGDDPAVQAALQPTAGRDLPMVLRRLCPVDTADACAVFDGARILSQAGVSVPWTEVFLSVGKQGHMYLAAPLSSPTPVFGATAPVATHQGLNIFVVRRLDAQLAANLSRAAGLSIRLISYRAFNAAPVDALTSLHSAGLADGRYAVAHIQKLDLYAASFPLFTNTGEVIALIEARLPAAQIDSEIRSLIHRLLVTALVLALLGVLAGAVLGQFVAGPVQDLTAAAVRLGQGDFSTSIPVGGTAEVSALARTMEDMRRNLVNLTGTLRRREAEAQGVLAGIVEGVFAVDRDRNIRYLNPQAAKLLGVDPQAAVGRFCGDLLKPQGPNGVRPCETDCPIVRARTAGTAQALERLGLNDAAPRTTIITSSGMVEGLQVQVLRDETELEAVRRARDSVLANISHEFRTPLAAQLASIELLRDGLQTMTPEAREKLVVSLERGSLRLTRLIDNLLESVRIESGQLSIRQQGVSLAEVVLDAHALVESLLRQRQQVMEVQLPEDLPLVRGDKTRLTQVFVNLIANANKFAPDDSVLRIGAVAHANQVEAWVEDEGPGVPAGDVGTVFERFRRGADDEPEPGGLGLGLWIVKSVVERHGGTIVVQRTAAQHTRFSFTLPIQPGSAP
ncbi:MAG TPA: ATP-binding protein [Steroidobacteraceae bacterium]|jgi:signal transduction histidine kinase|nr:ATP-binding protein [Steroidobacteraceae bacterium]